ncbi:hypothetical protein P170DRAFT_511529 [Aspergillus steynii IBT 23096]|uniref:Protein kinase domain-containing protein n=1 Tax=Aspergillus steynii IBT 23096 TaxID=1392250 RepID=A0A2I2G1V1_9EURO|nr:uncharacterized protein P170DRAFT_511529 [Aspergillus steynii IBT 23096]PLB46855.1 hypothetical protein P170DRAFT_511529 [Aspergillus steynii IBT 23096]
MELYDICPSELVFKETVHTLSTQLFFLLWFAAIVHRGRGPRRYYEPEDRELDIHVLESTAYRRLKDRGLCDSGIVPNFLGAIRNLDPSLYGSNLSMFWGDKYPPSAIFLEYIPNVEMIHLHNFTEKRMDGFIQGIHEIHQASVCHLDPRPRNMMVVRDDPERVIWMDFDRAETYDCDDLTDEQKHILQEEEVVVKELKQCLQAS